MHSVKKYWKGNTFLFISALHFVMLIKIKQKLFDQDILEVVLNEIKINSILYVNQL